MVLDFDVGRFISEKVTKRQQSLLAADLAANEDLLHERLSGARVMVIGGAGSIWSHYIKALLRYPVAKVCVVDIDENFLQSWFVTCAVGRWSGCLTTSSPIRNFGDACLRRFSGRWVRLISGKLRGAQTCAQ